MRTFRTNLPLLERPECAWITHDLEHQAQGHAIETVAPNHLEEVRTRRMELPQKKESAVKDRLTKKINYWDHRAETLKAQEQTGKLNTRLNSNQARKRADELQGRLQKRMEELRQKRQLSPLPPVVLGGLLIGPGGLLTRLTDKPMAGGTPALSGDTQAVAAKACAIIMQVERNLGFKPIDREFEKLGYDIESRIPGTGKLRFIEVKGRISGADTITVTRNAILYSLNKPEDFILAIVAFDGDTHRVHYVRQSFQREPDFGVTSVDYELSWLIAQGGKPS